MPVEVTLLQNLVAFHRDEQAYKAMFLHFHKRLADFAYNYVRSREVAEEIVSDVMIKIWQMKEVLSKIKKLDFYLFSATKNTALDYLSKNAKYNTVNIEEVEPDLDMSIYDPENLYLESEMRNKILHAIRSLPPKCQLVYKLIREEGFSYRETASILDISENTVDRHLSIAIQKLGSLLKGYFQKGV